MVCQLNYDWRMAFDPVLQNGMWHFVFDITSFAYWLFFLWILLIVISAVFNFCHGYITATEKKEKSKRLMLLIFFIVFPTYIIFATLFGAIGPEVGSYAISPYLLICISGLGLSYSNYQLFQISPLKAFNNIMNSMTNQVLVLNNELKVVYANEAGKLFIRKNINWQTNKKREIAFSLDQIFEQSNLNFESLTKELDAINHSDNLQKEIRINYSDGAKYMLLNFSPVFGKKEKLGYALVTSDLTRLNQFEERLEAYSKELQEKNEQLKLSNESLQQFAYVASHDLKEPLRMIGSYSSLLDKRYKQIIDESGRDFLLFIKKSVIRMETLLDDILEFSRTGNLPVPTEMVSVKDIMETVEANLTYCFENLSGTLIIHNENLPVIKAHRTQLIQLFQNLVSNGVKFKGDKDPIVIVDCDKKGDNFIFSVKDNGIGIAKENHKKVFEMFKRLNPKEEYEGTGIGLATCKRIVDSWDGDIWVESIEGEGSTFFFSYPCPIKELNKSESLIEIHN